MLIIDAFNVLHTTGVLPPDLADPGVPGLVRLIASSRYASRDLTIVCDGGGAASRSGVRMDRARILYSGIHREADDLIEDLIEVYYRGNPLEIVSSDARLRRAARRRRCASIPSDVFLSHLADDALVPRSQTSPDRLRAQVPLDAYSVDRWLEEFGLPRADRTPDPVAPAAPASPAPTDSATQHRARPKHKKIKKAAPPPASLGETLGLPPIKAPLPPPRTAPTAERPPEPAPMPVPGPQADRSQTKLPPDLDPLLLQALEEWRDRLAIDDLDMQKWAPDATPLTRRPPKRPR